MKSLRKLLWPLVPFYDVASRFYHYLYDTNIRSSKEFKIPLVCVGNLSVGGTGKSPMIEYLIRLLKQNNRVATLSRGYKRQTTGFVLAGSGATVESIGDEPFQFHKKFPDISVAVDSDRVRGVGYLLKLDTAPEIILLDDALQHRNIKAGLNILLTTFKEPYFRDVLLPAGDLREPRQGAKRADIIVVTKCPKNITDQERSEFISKMNPLPDQEVFFSTIRYGATINSVEGELPVGSLESRPFTLVTGIANAQQLCDELSARKFDFEHLEFADHHHFTPGEIEVLKKKEFVLTTEKDYWRLNGKLDATKLYYLPIEMEIDEGSKFNGLISDYLTKSLS